VPFVRVEDIRHLPFIFFDCFDDLLRLILIYSRIIGSVPDQERADDLVGLEKGRGVLDQLGVPRIVNIPHPHVEDQADSLPVAWN
jgi:hypothetical protein